MATAKELRAKLVIDAETEGEKSVEALVVDVEQLAAAGGDAAPRLQLLAAELRGLAQQQGLVDQFARLKAQTAAYAAEAEKAQASTKAAALALKEKQQALLQAQAAEQAAAASLAGVRQQHEQLGQAVAAAKAELKELGTASKEAGADTALQADRLKDVRAQLGVLQAEYRETGAQVKVLAAQQRDSATAMRQAGAEVKGATQAFDAQRTAAQRANQAYAQGREELQRTRDAMSEVGVSSANLAAAQVRIRREMELVRDRVAQVGTAHTEMAVKAQAATTSTVRSHRELSDKVHSISKELALLRSAYIGLQGLMSGGHALKGLADTADEVNNLQARVKLATGDGELFNQMWERVTQTALRTHSALEGTGTLFARIAATGKDAGLSAEKAAEQSLAVVETINQAVQLSGGSAESANAAITQLIQGLQSGVVRGEEFNSIMEQAPRLAQALADALGVTKGQLRAMAEEGRLTSEVVINALKSQAKAVRDEFATLPATIGRSVQDLSTAWSIFINETDKANGVSARVAGAIDLVANNLETLMEVAATAGKVMVVLFGAKVLQAVAGYTQAMLGAVRGTDALAASNVRASASIAATNAQMARAMTMVRGLGYTAIAAQLMDIVGNYARYREELQKHIAMNAEVQKKQEQVAQRLKAISDSTGVVVTSMQELNAAQAEGRLVFDEATGKYLSAQQAQEKLAASVKKTTQELAAQDASSLVAEFEKMAQGADKTKEAITKLADGLKFNDVQGASAFALALDELAARGKLSAKEVGEAWQQALGKLSAGEIGALRANLEEAARQGIISAQQWGQANEQILAASFDKLGVNAAQALGKISAGAQEAINAVDLVAESAKDAGVGVQESARAIEMAFAAAIPKADSLEAIDALEKQLKAMGEAGKISAEGIQRTQAALDKQRATIEAQIPGVQSLEEGLRNLGVKPQKELAALAASATQAFDAVKASGTATPRELSEAWKAMAEAAIEANNGVADASLKSQAQQYGMVIETDKAGKAIVKSMKEAEGATQNVGKAAVATADSIREIADAGWDANKDLVAQARAHNAAMAKVETSWIDASVAASKYSQEMAAVVWGANKNIEAMTREHALLVAQMEALAQQQEQLEGRGNDAAKGVDDLRLRLLELNGTEEEIARARNERDKAEVQRKMALMQIDLQRAQVSNKTEDATRLQEELDLLAEQLKLLDQIYREEEKQRKARERDGGGERGGSKGGRSGGDGGGVVTAPAPTVVPGPISITLNANGINDPARLARMIEPELARLARLAR